MPEWIWSLLCLFLFLTLLPRLLAFWTLKGIRQSAPSLEPVPPRVIQDWEKECLSGAAPILTNQGFRFVGWVRQSSHSHGNTFDQHWAVYENPTDCIWAVVAPFENPTPQMPFKIGYASFFAHGKILTTRSMGHRVVPVELPYYQEQNLWSEDWDALFAAHTKAHVQLALQGRAERMSLAAACHLTVKVESDIQAAMEKQNLATEAEHQADRKELRFSFKGLWIASMNLFKHRAEIAKAQKAWASKTATFPLPPRAEAEAYLRANRLKPEVGGWTKAILILGSFIAFSFISDGGFSWANGLSLLFIVFVHEMGHALAMRWVGYRDVQVFFIPFFGAIASGKKDKPESPWKEALVLLAGPVPGLLVGVTLVFTGYTEWLGPFEGAALTAIFVNAFNLLPVAPLDGGQLMQLILFNRFPKVGQVFLFFSALAIGAIAWYSEAPVLGFFALILIFSMFQHGKFGKSHPEMQAIRMKYAGENSAPDNPHPDLLSELFLKLREGNRINWTEKVTRIKMLLSEKISGGADTDSSSISWANSAGIFAVYLVVCLGPVSLLAYPYLSIFLNPIKPLTRADLNDKQGAVYDGLCQDSAVYSVNLTRWDDTLLFFVTAMVPDDSVDVTNRMHSQFDAIFTTDKIKMRVHAPVWHFGELDSSFRDSVYGDHNREVLAAMDMEEMEGEDDGNGEDEEDSYGDGEDTGKVVRAPLDSAQRDSVRILAENWRKRSKYFQDKELAIWLAWSPQERQAWLQNKLDKQKARLEKFDKSEDVTALLGICP